VNKRISDRQTILSTWKEHLYAEFQLKNADASVATMTENPHVFCIPSGTGGVGRAGVRDFYAKQFVTQVPPDFEMITVSESVADDRLIEEVVIRFTHTLKMDWMLPGVPPTGRRVEVGLVVIIQFENDKMASEHLYWDQASVLSQLGILDKVVAAAGIRSAEKLLELSARNMAESEGKSSADFRSQAENA